MTSRNMLARDRKDDCYRRRRADHPIAYRIPSPPNHKTSFRFVFPDPLGNALGVFSLGFQPIYLGPGRVPEGKD